MATSKEAKNPVNPMEVLLALYHNTVTAPLALFDRTNG